MPSIRQRHIQAKAGSTGRRPAAGNRDLTRQQTHPAAIVQRARLDPESLAALDVLQLQRTVGNRAVGRLLSGARPRPVIQPRLKVGPAHDPYEQEAERAAGQVMNAPGLSQGVLQPRRLSDGAGFEAGDGFEAALGAASGGASLPDHTRQWMEQRLGADFSGVKVHTDSQSDRLNRSIQAKAFTTGQDVFFSQGAYQPESRDGQALIAHELTHVVQQTGGQRPPAPGGGSRIQRTVWRYTSGAWVSESSSSSDTDGFPLPATYCTTNSITAAEHDKYDQNTGKYYAWADARDRTERRANAKKRPKNYGGFFDAGRETTPYGYFKPRAATEARSKQQGPHLTAHVTKRTVFDMAEEMGLDPETILGSKLAPSPRRALKMMQDMLSTRGIPYKAGGLSVWYREYKRAYAKGLAKKPGWKQGVKQALELHPLTTYRVGEVASSAELAGKQEDGSMAVSDIDTLLAATRSGGLPGSLTTVDTGYTAEGWNTGDPLREDFIFNYAYAATGRPPSPSNYPEAPMSPPQDDNW